jgi:uncharacterized protein YegP (UPF0339 family)
MSKFVLRASATGYKFDLLATNGQAILTSEVYTSRAAAVKGAASIRLNVPKARVENQTEEGYAVMGHPKFEMYQDKAGQYRFRLKAKNGKIIGTSERYSSKLGCLNGIESVQTNAPGAEIEG